ncbi:glycosyltransferase [Polymorphobacter sp.]|uniref:glycosyltransferase n=1 Tax=Polymorphobacter sp. TaxID=1909290 RepID=UPI003F6EFCD1
MSSTDLSGRNRPLLMFAIPELASGGPDRVMAELLRDLPRDRFRLALVVSRAGGRYFDQLPADVDVFVLDGGRYPVRALANLIDRVRPALVFTTLRMNLTAELATWLQRHRPPLVVRQANAIAADFAVLRQRSLVKHRIAHWLVKRAFTRADAVVAQSIDMADEIAPTLRRGQRLATIGNPIDIDATRALARQQARTHLPGQPALIGVGRLARQKGFDLLITAMPAILAEHPDAALTLVGSGEEREALLALAETHGVSDCVHLPGQSEGVLATIAAADLYISSARYEGFSNAMLEAMAMRTPVVATPCPGATREMIIDGETGILADAMTPEAIAAAVLRALAADPVRLTAGAERHVRALYAPSVIVGRYAGLFEALLSPTQSASSASYSAGVPQNMTSLASTIS